MKQGATPDASFWVNAFGSGLLPHVLDRFGLSCAQEVVRELPAAYSSGRELRRLLDLGVVREVAPSRDWVGAFGPGERAAINLAIEHPEWLLLLDDRRPFEEAARRAFPWSAVRS